MKDFVAMFVVQVSDVTSSDVVWMELQMKEYFFVCAVVLQNITS